MMKTKAQRKPNATLLMNPRLVATACHANPLPTLRREDPRRHPEHMPCLFGGVGWFRRWPVAGPQHPWPFPSLLRHHAPNQAAPFDASRLVHFLLSLGVGG